MISLNQLLESRDARAEHQKDLLGRFPGKSLLCLTVQLPGPEKRNEQSLAIAKAGVSAIRQAFQPDYEELRDLETGYEGYFLVSLPALEAKRKAVEVEDNHPLGRLMDIDVLHGVPEKNQFSSAGVKAISREEIGLAPRRCLLCENEVRYCMRAKTHTTSELLERIKQILEEYELQTP
ncbi:MAG: citrate lyase holo-[Bacteroidales bacterium]|nr:citrate lyase holo-[acyl-carrier protein] synthase [Bacteroidales bacterium]MBR0175130.1 citrate lyase holo-[acyl-carrier protein] synthase [Bacteroidales bacterium]